MVERDEPTNSEIEEIVRKEPEERNLEGLVREGMLIIPDKEKRQTSVLFQGVKAGKGKIIVN